MRPETVAEVLKLTCDLKCNKEALEAATEFIRLFTIEAIGRSAAHCISESKRTRIIGMEGKPSLSVDDLEAILCQLLLDF